MISNKDVKYLNENRGIDISKNSTIIREFLPVINLEFSPFISRSCKLTSKFGGNALLPKGVDWPTKNGKALDFIAFINLEELSLSLEDLALPITGYITIFCDLYGEDEIKNNRDYRKWEKRAYIKYYERSLELHEKSNPVYQHEPNSYFGQSASLSICDRSIDIPRPASVIEKFGWDSNDRDKLEKFYSDISKDVEIKDFMMKPIKNHISYKAKLFGHPSYMQFNSAHFSEDFIKPRLVFEFLDGADNTWCIFCPQDEINSLSFNRCVVYKDST